MIVGMDGKAVDNPAQFQRALAEAPIGQAITLSVIREGARREVRVQVEQQQVRARTTAE